ncbi:MAG: AAA family ATPase, partial [Verrucomicrobia bacterium]|nr:AAA family ATPase [Verrucomicrobiota bacterium]
MLFRKIQSRIQQYLKSDPNKVLIVSGARQVGKTYIIRDIGGKLFRSYVEINLLEDSLGAGLFKNVRTVEDFYLALSMKAGNKMRDRKNTLIFLDEIQAYPHLLTLLKFLKQDNKYTYIASGSLLGVTLAESSSIPIGSIEVIQMYPLDFEEFLRAN